MKITVPYKKLDAAGEKTPDAVSDVMSLREFLRTKKGRCHCSFFKVFSIVFGAIALSSCIMVIVVMCLPFPLHASCKINWAFDARCPHIHVPIVNQIKNWTGTSTCMHGGERCLYQLVSDSENEIHATHTTPYHHYKDDLSFRLKQDGHICRVFGYSRSETWYAELDWGTNYCNLHNLIIGAGLDKTKGYREMTIILFVPSTPQPTATSTNSAMKI